MCRCFILIAVQKCWLRTSNQHLVSKGGKRLQLMLHGGIRANFYLKKQGCLVCSSFDHLCVCLRLPHAMRFNQKRNGDAAQVDMEPRRRASVQYPGLIKQRPVSRWRKCETVEVSRSDIKKPARCSSDNGVNCLIGGEWNVPITPPQKS